MDRCKKCGKDLKGLIACRDSSGVYCSNRCMVVVDDKKEDAKRDILEASRFNEGKVDYSLLPLDLMDGLCRVMEYGSKKYKRNNYRKGYSDLNSPLASILRHLVEVQKSIDFEDLNGEKGMLFDKETEYAHIHHLLASVVIMVHSMRLKGYKV